MISIVVQLVREVGNMSAVSQFNPRFLEVFKMVDTISKVHAGEIDEMELAYQELKRPDGTVYQIVPYLRVAYKG